MTLNCHIACGLVCVILFPGLALPAMPAGRLTDAGQDALLGCRWRRSVTVVPPKQRAESVQRTMPYAEEFVWLRPNFDKGPPYYVEMTTDTKQIMKVMGHEVEQTQTQTFYLRYTPLGRNQNEDGLLRVQIIGIKMKIEIGGVNIQYDSQDTFPTSAMSSFFKALLDADLVFTIDPTELKVKKIEGHEDLIKNVGVTTPQMEPLLKSILGTEALAEAYASSFLGFLPKQPVRRGDAWDQQSKLDLGSIGTFPTLARYTYDGKVNAFDRIRSRSNLIYEAPRNKGALSFQIRSAILRSTLGEGEILFDAAKGRLVESTQRMNIAGNLTIEVGGVETSVEMDQAQTARVRVTDANPLGRGK